MGTAPSDIFSALWMKLQTDENFQQNQMYTYHQFSLFLCETILSWTRCQDNRTK